MRGRALLQPRGGYSSLFGLGQSHPSFIRVRPTNTAICYRPYVHRQMGHRRYSTIVDAGVSTAAAEQDEDGGNGPMNAYEVTDRSRPADQAVHGTVGNSPPYGSAAVYPMYRSVPVGFQHGPPMPSAWQSGVDDYYGRYGYQQQQQHVSAKHDKIDWQKIGILALFKIGLAKIKAFSFLKILFLLVFKLKLFLIAVFFKFLLILKLMKLVKLMTIPMLLAMFLPMMSSLASPTVIGGLLSLPNRIIDFLTQPVYAPAAIAATHKHTVSAEAAKTNANAGGGSSSKPDDPSTPGHRRRRLNAIDPALDAFWNVLDSEKCVERIACRVAVVERIGILPAWINW